MTKLYDGRIPFDEDGELLSNPWMRETRKNIDWRPNTIFDAELTFIRITSGSPSNFLFMLDKHAVPMFYSVLDEVIPKMEKGVLRGYFSYAKRGNYFGIIPMDAP